MKLWKRNVFSASICALVVFSGAVFTSSSAVASPYECAPSNTPTTWSALKLAIADSSATSQSPAYVCLDELSDLTLNSVSGDRLALAPSGYVILDLNGHSLTIEAPQALAAIQVGPNASLTIVDSAMNQNNRLHVTGGIAYSPSSYQNGSGAGIGGDGGDYNSNAQSSGEYIQVSGRVIAIGGNDGAGGNTYNASGAGIGGGAGGTGTSTGGSCGVVTVYGGFLTAQGGNMNLTGGSSAGAGIGGGGANYQQAPGTGCDVEIEGGIISATGGTSMGNTNSNRSGPAFGPGAAGTQNNGVFSAGALSIITDTYAWPGAEQGNGYDRSWAPAMPTLPAGNSGVHVLMVGHNSTAASDPATFVITYSYQVDVVVPNGTTSSPASSMVTYGDVAPLPNSPVSQQGYDFGYWYVQQGTPFDFSTPITLPITLTVAWDVPTSTTTLAQTGTGISAVGYVGVVVASFILGGFLLRQRKHSSQRIE